MLGVVEPMMCGLGGDLFAIVWDAKTGKLYGLNASGRAPSKATIELFHSKKLKAIPTHGPLSCRSPAALTAGTNFKRGSAPNRSPKSSRPRSIMPRTVTP